MVVQFPCLVCNIVKNYRAVQCNLRDFWVHIACNNLNLYTYWKLQKAKSPWYCMCSKGANIWIHQWYKVERPTTWRSIVSPNPKIISSTIKQSKNFDEEILKKASNRFSTWMNLALHWKASIWHHNSSVCALTYPVYLITTLSYIIYFLILKLNQI